MTVLDQLVAKSLVTQSMSQTLSTTAPLMSAQLMAGNVAGSATVNANNGPTTTQTSNILSQTLAQSLATSSLPTVTLPSIAMPTAAQTPINNVANTAATGDINTTIMTTNTTSTTVGPTPAATSSPSMAAIKNPVVILDKTRLQELVQEVDPNEQLEEDVEDMLLTIADEFIESLVYTSTLFAKHRKSSTLDVRDVQLALEKNWKMWIPGFGTTDDQQRHHKKSFTSEAHKQRMALIKKTLKKF